MRYLFIIHESPSSGDTDHRCIQSFLLIALGLNTIATMLTMLIFQLVPAIGPLFNHIPPGPTAIIFSVLYQYFRLVPEAYKFKVFGIAFSNKIWVYATASQVSCPLRIQPLQVATPTNVISLTLCVPNDSWP